MMRNKGFTLLEVLVGTAVLAMMVLLVWSITSSNLNSVERISRRDEIFQRARFAMQRMTNDINMAFLVTNSGLLGKTKNGSIVETGLIGSVKGGFGSLDFSSLSNFRMFRDAKEGDQAVIGYYVEPDPENREIYTLMRRESPVLGDDITKGGKAYPIAEGISDFKLEFYDGRVNDWTEDWNSKEVDFKDKLPRAVKITLSFPDPDNEDEKITFSTIAFIELWQFPIEF